MRGQARRVRAASAIPVASARGRYAGGAELSGPFWPCLLVADKFTCGASLGSEHANKSLRTYSTTSVRISHHDRR